MKGEGRKEARRMQKRQRRKEEAARKGWLYGWVNQRGCACCANLNNYESTGPHEFTLRTGRGWEAHVEEVF
jgi:hypothetical protein